MSDKTRRHMCERCWLHAYAERKPGSLLARLWRWHTGWCPGWRSYQRRLAERERAGASEPESK
jgi:hypothetical protein